MRRQGALSERPKHPSFLGTATKYIHRIKDGLINQWSLVAEEANSQAYYIYHYHKLKFNTNIIMVNARFL